MEPRLLSEVQRANVRYHTLLAPNYYRQPFLRNDNRIRVREVLVDLQRRTGGRRLLDLGCGTGFIFDAGHDVFEKLDGVDITPDMLKRVKPRPNIAAYVASVESLPFASGQFDVVTCNSVLHHIDDIGRALTEARRVLRPQGIFYADEIPSADFREALSSLDGACDMSELLKSERWKMTGDVERYERLGIANETTRIAMAQCYRKRDLHPERLRELLIRSGFQAVDVRYRWFPGQAQIRDTWGDESARRVEEYLLSLLPLTRHLFKNLMLIAS